MPFLKNSYFGKFFWSFVYTIIYFVGAGITNSMSLTPVLFPLKKRKDAASERRIGWKGVCFPPKWNFALVNNLIRALFPICTLTCRVSSYVSRQEENNRGRSDSAICFYFLVLLKPCFTILSQLTRCKLFHSRNKKRISVQDFSSKKKFKRNIRKCEEQRNPDYVRSKNDWRVPYTSFREDWRQGY